MGEESMPDGKFKWVCPFCDTSRVNVSNAEGGRENAIAALQGHILASDGAAHGPRNRFPDGFEDIDLPENIVRIDGD